MRALGRFRVLDLTRVRSGPTCVRVLADFGADVIRIESPPGMDPTGGMNARDSSDALNLHRNKRSITLNLKEPAARQIMKKLVETADVVVENYRPDVKDRLGLDYDTLSAINPRIILASISAFGQTGPYKDRPGFARVAHAMGGIAYLAGMPKGTPVTPGSTTLGDYMTGLYGCFGVLMALRHRDRTGEGQYIDAALYESKIGRAHV